MSEFGVFSNSFIRPDFIKSQTQQDKRVQKAETVSPSTSSKSFIETLQSIVGDTNEALRAADKASEDFTAGRAKNLHEVMISMEKADLSLRTVNSVRNKVVEAYQEIMRMQV